MVFLPEAAPSKLSNKPLALKARPPKVAKMSTFFRYFGKFSKIVKL